jgi:hypothetical protein
MSTACPQTIKQSGFIEIFFHLSLNYLYLHTYSPTSADQYYYGSPDDAPIAFPEPPQSPENQKNI